MQAKKAESTTQRKKHRYLRHESTQQHRLAMLAITKKMQFARTHYTSVISNSTNTSTRISLILVTYTVITAKKFITIVLITHYTQTANEAAHNQSHIQISIKNVCLSVFLLYTQQATLISTKY